MSKEIKEFVEKMKNWEKNFPVEEYDYTKYDCEIAQMALLYKKNRKAFLEYCAEFYSQQINLKKFCLKHPLYNDILCQATRSFSPLDCNGTQPAFVNFLFMIDKNNQYPFILLQVHNIFDYILLPNVLMKFPWTFTHLKDRFDSFPNTISFNELRFQDKDFIFSLEQWRPVHFFEEILHGIYVIHDSHGRELNITSDNAFFIPKKVTRILKSKPEVCVRPVIAPLRGKVNGIRKLLEESLQDFNTLVSPQDIEDKFDKTQISPEEILSLIPNDLAGAIWSDA